MRRIPTIFIWIFIGLYAIVRKDKATEHAKNPTELSGSAWKRVLLQTKTALKDKDLSTMAAGLAYYATLSFFPVALGSAALYASLVSPDALRTAIDGLQGIVPDAIYSLIDTTLSPLANVSKSSTIVATIISILALLWTTSGGVQSLVKATNVTYDTEETRNPVKLRLASVFISIGVLILGSAAVILLVLRGDALENWGLPHVLAISFPYVRWILLLLIITTALAFIYRYAPNRSNPRWQWVSPGALAASLLWVAVTALFFLYAQKFGSFNETYGIFAGLVVLMIWFNVSSLIVLIGAQVNKKLEDATDTKTQTTG